MKKGAHQSCGLYMNVFCFFLVLLLHDVWDFNFSHHGYGCEGRTPDRLSVSDFRRVFFFFSSVFSAFCMTMSFVW